ncbi:hypothetical protein J502_2811 [Acinetobacter sp. 1294596]|uniref:Uncharacterized protein n=1 Tax=Acinetobacter radioresistens SK82 TaxID=596318 RepID=A0ABP2GQC0_ACIRA|nr:hypothetical protein ACIRA0001_1160 [Acinetobacter radioresistens SK82]EXB82776.1 hypothetical protein J538_2396 [Acinetobacter sp. 272263]EXE56428.1 hypothetical protein J579_2571 [Acinetobacter sp. 1239920]EXF56113.1 hypothetical protein J502_2811 [Acinetobacter sp. 1294596]
MKFALYSKLSDRLSNHIFFHHVWKSYVADNSSLIFFSL